tara:strand:- start:18234 stop:18512 length:279 start_codon:yes stop_codon:yes gene_type:complete
MGVARVSPLSMRVNQRRGLLEEGGGSRCGEGGPHRHGEGRARKSGVSHGEILCRYGSFSLVTILTAYPHPGTTPESGEKPARRKTSEKGKKH